MLLFKAVKFWLLFVLPFHFFNYLVCGLFYKHTTIINYTSSNVNKLEALITDDARAVIYNRHVFIVQATDVSYLLHAVAPHRVPVRV